MLGYRENIIAYSLATPRLTHSEHDSKILLISTAVQNIRHMLNIHHNFELHISN